VGDLGPPPGPVEHAIDALARQGTIGGPGKEQRLRAPLAPVLVEHGAQVGREHDVAIVPPLALFDAHHHALAIDVGDAQVGHLGDAQAGPWS